jgi:hypothetical protein
MIGPIPKLIVRGREIRLPAAGMRVEVLVASPNPPLEYLGLPEPVKAVCLRREALWFEWR